MPLRFCGVEYYCDFQEKFVTELNKEMTVYKPIDIFLFGWDECLGNKESEFNKISEYNSQESL